jgi:hypothetical protein
LKRKLIALAAGLVLASQAHALTIGGVVYADNGVADKLISSAGSYDVTGAASLQQAVTDASLETYATSFSSGANLVLGWASVVALNGEGVDIALVDMGLEPYSYSQEDFDSFIVTINGTTKQYFSGGTSDYAAERQINVAAFDLSDFGIAAGASITSMQIGMDFHTRETVPALSLAVARYVEALPVDPGTPPVSAVPEPSTYAMLLAGLGAIGFIGRRKKAARQ